jgi:hypothetical protein
MLWLSLLYQTTLDLKGNVLYHKNMLCEDQPSMQQMGSIQMRLSRTNNRAAYKMNFRFQDEKET